VNTVTLSPRSLSWSNRERTCPEDRRKFQTNPKTWKLERPEKAARTAGTVTASRTVSTLAKVDLLRRPTRLGMMVGSTAVSYLKESMNSMKTLPSPRISGARGKSLVFAWVAGDWVSALFQLSRTAMIPIAPRTRKTKQFKR
jgi:hypothetical protein